MIRRNPDIAALLLLAVLLLPASFRQERILERQASPAVRLVTARGFDQFPERVGVRLVERLNRIHERLANLPLCPFDE